MFRSSRAARRRSRFAHFTRVTRALPAATLAAGTLIATNHPVLAASQTYTGTGFFSTGFGGSPAANGNALIFAGATPTTVTNDQTGLTLGAGTNNTGSNPFGGGTYLGDALDFTSATNYTLTGNAITLDGNVHQLRRRHRNDQLRDGRGCANDAPVRLRVRHRHGKYRSRRSDGHHGGVPRFHQDRHRRTLL